MSDSIYVSATTGARIRAVAKLLLPLVAVAATAGWTSAYTWVRTRSSSDDVSAAVGACKTDTKDLVDKLQTQHALVYALQSDVQILAELAIDLHAQSEVERAYGASPRRVEYIDRAVRWHRAEYARRLAEVPGDVRRALTLTRLAVWRPDRD